MLVSVAVAAAALSAGALAQSTTPLVNQHYEYPDLVSPPSVPRTSCSLAVCTLLTALQGQRLLYTFSCSAALAFADDTHTRTDAFTQQSPTTLSNTFVIC